MESEKYILFSNITGALLIIVIFFGLRGCVMHEMDLQREEACKEIVSD